MEKAKFKIVCNEDSIHTKVFMDDKDISSVVKEIRLEQEAGEAPHLYLDIVGTEITMEGEFAPPIPEIYRKYIKE